MNKKLITLLTKILHVYASHSKTFRFLIKRYYRNKNFAFTIEKNSESISDLISVPKHKMNE